MGAFATGVTVITTLDHGGRPTGITVNSLTSVSLAPPLILWCVGHNARSVDLYRQGLDFVVNVLSTRQQALAALFAAPEGGPYKDSLFEYGDRGIPSLPGSVAEYHCRVTECLPGGDHTIVLAAVEGIRQRAGAPLIFHRGRFSTLAAVDDKA